jgi:hypothetical protein
LTPAFRKPILHSSNAMSGTRPISHNALDESKL